MLPDVSTKQARARFYGSSTWRQLRQSILERDHFECQWCKAEGRVTMDAILEVDHIQELKDHPELALDPDNLRTLCKDCHNRRHDRMNYRGEPKKRKWDDEWW
ncbi:HNH endonuclease signature motif containing protein [Enterococcus asini]|uniref:HNH endonuclease n=1 Tax=Enterococcus asini TaxID=57732 RepID=UPI0032E496E5